VPWYPWRVRGTAAAAPWAVVEGSDIPRVLGGRGWAWAPGVWEVGDGVGPGVQELLGVVTPGEAPSLGMGCMVCCCCR
jgi:hypothetical protein